MRAGEIITGTNNGEVAATLIPPSSYPFERLLLSGNVRAANQGVVDFRLLPRTSHGGSSAEILADLRGDR
ncbi:prevent-host-death protein antitoxin of TAS system [Arthrobacter sp. JZ12]|uniref:prevent-host-death protein antitoxin of TAS system n=1 Tax=Arthrobacter sp. JZ12 TaxID=2654190 RepID=UPI002B465570|nr:prevent-host-death protein antitoxin of TAS system [Arthrobacter sp. JZ12]